MSILREDQIEDLCDLLTGADTWLEAKSKIKNWNEKQTDTNEPNWDEIAKEIKGVQHRYYYFDDRGEQINWHVVKQYIRPIPCHPHAEIMMKYAEVAARRVDPWEEFEYRHLSEQWSKCVPNFIFYTDYKFRYVGEQ